MKFIVEVPAYVEMELFAPSAGQAAHAAEEIVAKRLFFEGEIIPIFGGMQHISPRVRLLAEGEDREPDVYICRGGKLAVVTPAGVPEPTGEDCD